MTNTLDALEAVMSGSPAAFMRRLQEDDSDDEIINKVGRGHKNRKKYKPAIDAKCYVNNDEKFLSKLGVPSDLAKNVHLNTNRSRILYNPEVFVNAINIVWFKFFAIEFYDALFTLSSTTIPSIVNIEYDFMKFTHQVTNPLFVGSKLQKVKYEPNRIYRLEHQDVNAKISKEVQSAEWFWNDMFEFEQVDQDSTIIFRLANIKVFHNINVYIEWWTTILLST